MEGEPGGRNSYDPEGRLQLTDGSVVAPHDWTAEDWARSHHDGVAWLGAHANWTRFINHSAKHRNLSLRGPDSVKMFGRSHAIYAARPIAKGEELFITCAPLPLV